MARNSSCLPRAMTLSFRAAKVTVASVVGKNEERAVASLFSPGGTHVMKGEFAGTGDFEVLALRVVLPPAGEAGKPHPKESGA